MTSIISGIAKTVGGIVGIGGNSTPAPAPTVITPPPPSSTTTDQAANVQSQEDLIRQRQGRAANLLTSTSGVNSTPTGTKTLLGQ